MPRTAHRGVYEESFGKGSVIMRAVGPHGKQLVTLPHENYVLVIDAAEDHGAVGKIAQGKAVPEIGLRRLVVCHEVS